MFKFNTFSELVNGAIILEDAHLAHKAEKKEKSTGSRIFEQRPTAVSPCPVGPAESPLSAPATAAVGVSATPVYIVSGGGQASCSSAERAEGLGAAAGGTPQFVSVLQLWAAGALYTELPDATKAGPAVRSAEPEAERGSFQAGASALHHPRGHSRGSSSDGGYVFHKRSTRYGII